jgi:hypothetical protein
MWNDVLPAELGFVTDPVMAVSNVNEGRSSLVRSVLKFGEMAFRLMVLGSSLFCRQIE